MATALKVTIGPDRISLGPGESADIEVTVQNASQVVEHFTATVIGLPSNDLWSCEPDVVKLRPREVGTLRLKIEVPERGGLVAGPYILAVVVKSPYSQEVSRAEELPMDVRPAPALTMTAQPEVVNGGKVGHYAVNLANEGNMPMAVTLSGTDPENRVGFKFEPKELRLEPGMAAGAQITVNSDPPLTGQEIRRMMTLRAHSGDTVVEKPLTFVQRPRIRGGMMKFGALAAGLAVLGGMTYGGAKVLRDLKTTQAAQQAPLPQVQQTLPIDPNANKNPNNNQSSGAPTPSNPQQSQATTPPQSQGTTPPPPPPTSGAPQQLSTTDYIDFRVGPDSQPLVQDGPIEPNHWFDKGLTLQNILDKAPIDCTDARQQVLRISRVISPKNPVGGAGAYLSTSKPRDPATCSMMPIRMIFDKPLSQVNVFFTGLPGMKYTATMTFMDGNTFAVDGVGTKIGDQVVIPYQVQPNAPLIKYVTFAHSSSVQDSTEASTLLTGVGYTRK